MAHLQDIVFLLSTDWACYRLCHRNLSHYVPILLRCCWLRQSIPLSLPQYIMEDEPSPPKSNHKEELNLYKAPTLWLIGRPLFSEICISRPIWFRRQGSCFLSHYQWTLNNVMKQDSNPCHTQTQASEGNLHRYPPAGSFLTRRDSA